MSCLRLIIFVVVAAVGLSGLQPEPVVAGHTEAQAVTAFARAQLGKPYRWGAIGLRRYDCSGLVYRTFQETDLLNRIGKKRRTARGYFRWFRERGLVTRNPRPGDLVVWGRPVSHIGIFLRYNRYGRAIALSALTTGVAKHRVRAINVPFRAYLRVKLER